MSAPDVLSGRVLWDVERADAVAYLDALPAGLLDLVFFSPPYTKARLYLENGEDLGIARDAEAWSAWMACVFRSALRACRGLVACVCEGQTTGYRYDAAPALLMADLHRAGVHLRKPPVYRRVGIPGSGGPDWLRNDWEWIVCATNGGKLPWSDNTACGHPPKFGPGGEMSHRMSDGTRVNQWGKAGTEAGANGSAQRRRDGGRQKAARPSHKMVKLGATRGYKNGDTLNEGAYVPPALANPGNVIDCKVGGGLMGGDEYASLNEAPFPEKLAEFFVRSFCPENGIVCDPFAGSGTTLAVARRWGRRAIGCDIRQSQVDLAARRLRAGETMFDGLDAPGDKEDARA